MAGLISPNSGGGQRGSDASSSINSLIKKKGGYVGSHMSLEEIRINKAILKEISRKKKLDMGSQDNHSILSNGLVSPKY
jgi:hypothetical protein